MGLPTSAGHGTRQWPIESGDLGRREIPVCSPTAIMHDADARSRDGKEVQACRATPARRKLRSRTQEPGTPKNDHSPMRTPCRGSTRFNAPPQLSPNTPCPCLVCSIAVSGTQFSKRGSWTMPPARFGLSFNKHLASGWAYRRRCSFIN